MISSTPVATETTQANQSFFFSRSLRLKFQNQHQHPLPISLPYDNSAGAIPGVPIQSSSYEIYKKVYLKIPWIMEHGC